MAILRIVLLTENFWFDAICNIIQEPQELRDTTVPVGSSVTLLW